MRIGIGSRNPVKCSAVRSVLAPLYPGAEFFSVNVPSSVSAQPWGDKETRSGALHRARAVLNHPQVQLGVGLEGGVVESEFGLMTTAWCVLVDSHGRTGVGGSSCVVLPPVVANDVRNGLELGTAIDRLVQQPGTKHMNGAIGILTNDLETRQSAFETVIRFALAPFLHSEWY